MITVNYNSQIITVNVSLNVDIIHTHTSTTRHSFIHVD